MDYYRFSEEHGKEWPFMVHKFWRRLSLDTSYSRALTPAMEQAVTDYLEEVPRYARWRKEHDPEAKINLFIDILPRPKGRGFLLDGDVPPREC